MIIYESVNRPRALEELRPLVPDVASHLFPAGEILYSEPARYSDRLILKNGERLTAIELYPHDLAEEAFETILRTCVELEAKRREKKDATLKEVGLCVLASAFSQELIDRVRPGGLLQIRLFAWSLIRAEGNEALLIREVGSTFEHVSSAPVEALNATLPHNTPRQTLSTPELAALDRFGAELNERRAQLENAQ